MKMPLGPEGIAEFSITLGDNCMCYRDPDRTGKGKPSFCIRQQLFYSIIYGAIMRVSIILEI